MISSVTWDTWDWSLVSIQDRSSQGQEHLSLCVNIAVQGKEDQRRSTLLFEELFEGNTHWHML